MGRKNGTDLQDLPDDSDTEADQQHVALIKGLLNIKQTSPHEYHSRMKYIFIATGLFAVLSLPMVDSLIKMAVPMIDNSWLFTVGVKTALFFGLFFLLFTMNMRK